MNGIFIHLVTCILQVSCLVRGPYNTQVSAGKNVTLECDVRLNGISFVTWIDKSSNTRLFTKYSYGTVIRNKPDPRFSMDKSSYNLNIAWAQIKDSGDYACHVGRIDYTAKLTVYAGLPVFISALGNTFAKMGSDVTLKCRVSGADEVKWEVQQWKGIKKIYKTLAHSKKGNKILTNSGDSSKAWTKVEDNDPYKDYIFDLTIFRAKMSDEGFYKCRATNEHFPDIGVNRYGNLKVNSTCNDPQFYLEPSDNEILVKSTTVVRCWLTITSAKVSVRWVKFPPNDTENGIDLGVKLKENKGKPMSYSSRYSWGWEENESIEINKYDLIITDVKKEDAGTFVCEVTILECPNHDVSKVAHAKLAIVDLQDYQFDSVKNVDAFQGDYRALRCDTSNRILKNRAIDKIVWYDRKFNVLFEGDKRIKKDSRLTLEKQKHGVYIDLLISRILQIDAGSYYCVIYSDPPIWQEIRLHVYGCPSSLLGYGDWTHNRDLDKCYTHLKGTRSATYGVSEVYCRRQGGHLAMPKTSQEVNYLIHYTKTYMTGNVGLKKKNYIWLGADLLRGGSTWIWADGSTMHTWQALWSGGPPYLKINTRRCVKLNLTSARFEIEECTEHYPSICETTNEAWVRNLEIERKRCPEGWIYFECGLECYWISSEGNLTWNEAVDQCRKIDSKIFSSNSNSEIRNLIIMQKYHFLKNPGVWTDIKPKSNEMCISVLPNGTQRVSDCDLNKNVVCVKQQNYLTIDDLYTTCGKSIKDLKARKEGKSEEPFKKRDTRYSSITREKSKTNYQRRISDGISYNLSMRVRREITPNSVYTDIVEFPWMVKVYIRKENKFLLKCAGSIISAKHILTAARCLGDFKIQDGKSKFNKYSPNNVVISWGSDHESMSSGHTVEVQRILVHNNFLRSEYINKRNQLLYDVAILEISKILHTDCPKLRPVCTTCAPCSIDFTTTRCVLAGFGKGGNRYVKGCDVKNLGDHLDGTSNFYRIDKEDCDVGEKDSGAPVACISTTAHDPQWKLVGVMSTFDDDQVYFTKLSKVFMWMYMLINNDKNLRHVYPKESESHNNKGVELRPATWMGVLSLIIMIAF